jgi:glutaredoxin
MTRTTSTTSTPSGNDAPRNRTLGNTVGLALLHGGTAGWIGYGALMKALDLNPQLLPSPVLKLLTGVAKSMPGDATAFLDHALRAIIGVEVFLALAILFSTRYARLLAVLTLGLFCAILSYAIIETALKDGLQKALTGSCGCFGEKGLPATVMLAVDSALLLSAIFLAPHRRAGSLVPLVGAAIAGAAVAVFTPSHDAIVVPSAGQTQNTNPAGTQQGPAPAAAPTEGVSSPWPPSPLKYEKIYFPKFKDWIGKPFRDQKLALAISRPMPADLEKGDWLVTFSRPDCDHCQAFYRAHFAAPRKERVLKVSIKDSTGTPLAMPCVGCEEHEVYRVKAGEPGKSPEYLLQTPCVVRLKDGVVTAVCTDVDNAEELAKVLAPADAGVAAAPAVHAEQPAERPDPKTVWPGLPAKIERTYLPEFSEFVGKRFNEIPFATLIDGKVPDGLLKGRWIVIYFREDCDHCHMLLSTYFTGKLPVRTMTVAIPDADPKNLLDHPCDECAKVSLVKGPNYILSTPVVLSINDGVVECVVENADDMQALEACLKFPK